MKTKRDLIKTINIVRGNLSHIESTGIINGTLLIEIERVMEEYAEQQVKNLNIPAVSKSLPICNVESCEKWQSLAKHKVNLIAENEQLRQRLIDAGLERPAIRIDYSRHS